MAQYEHLPIYKKAMDLAIYVENIVRGFSKYHKYTLGTDLRNLSRTVVRLVIKANSEKEKTATLLLLRDTIEELKVCFRICKEVKAGARWRVVKIVNVTFENIYQQYLKCRKNKRGTINALAFEVNAEEKLFDPREELNAKTYTPSRAICFVVEQPKMREIIAADFRDRVAHHVLVDRLEAIYEPVFISLLRQGERTFAS